MKKKKIAIGAWAFEEFEGPQELYENVKKLGFNGVCLGGNIRPEDYETQEKRNLLRSYIVDNGLEVPEYGIDVYGAHALLDSDEWLRLAKRNIEFADSLGITRTVRVDTGVPPVLPEGMEYEKVKDFYVKAFRQIARKAAQYGMNVVWEFEPGFMLNEPANVLQVVCGTNEPNFKLEFDCCHAYNCAVAGLGCIEKGMTLEGGIIDFIKMCKNQIGMVHLIDTDGTVVNVGIEIKGASSESVELVTSKHSQFGTGLLNFDEIIPALINDANYDGDWWVCDMELTPFQDVPRNLEFVRNLNDKYCE